MDNKVVGLIRTGGVILLFIIGAILIIGAMKTETEAVSEETAPDYAAVVRSVNFSLYLVYACLGAILIFTVWSIIQNPKRFIPSAIGIAVFVIILLIGYGMASSEPIAGLEHADNISKNVRMGGTGINATGILVAIAGGLIAVGWVMGIMRFFSK